MTRWERRKAAAREELRFCLIMSAVLMAGAGAVFLLLLIPIGLFNIFGPLGAILGVFIAVLTGMTVSRVLYTIASTR